MPLQNGFRLYKYGIWYMKRIEHTVWSNRVENGQKQHPVQILSNG